MNKIILVTLVCTMLLIASCSYIENYLPEESPTGNVVLENPFVFANESNATDVEVIDLNKDDNDDVEIIDVEPTEEDSIVLATVTATEGDIVSLSDIIAQDPDGDVVEYTYGEPFSSLGLWQTNDGDEGKYLVTVEATDGLLSTSEQIQVVILASNKGPVIDCPTSVIVNEGETIDLDCLIFDREGDEVTYSFSGFLQDFEQETDFDDAGEYTAIISASDGNRQTIHEIEITIADTNRLPSVVELESILVEEEESIELVIEASDADGDDLSVEYPVLFDADGIWQTSRGDAGNYELEAIVSDGKGEVAVPVSITVTKKNSAPVISVLTDIVVNEGDLIDLELEVTDVDEEDLLVTIEGFMTTERYQTTFNDAGQYEVTITATDGKATSVETVDITVIDVNRPPVFIIRN